MSDGHDYEEKVLQTIWLTIMHFRFVARRVIIELMLSAVHRATAPGPEDIKIDIGQNHLRDCGIENEMRNVAPIHLPFRELRK